MLRASCAILGMSVFLLSATAGAEPPLRNRCRGGDCPRSAYSPLHYWAPTWIRVRDCIRQPSVTSHLEIRPEIPPTYQIIRYPCPEADPESIPYGVSHLGLAPAVDSPPQNPQPWGLE
jgi:hypothetical protein